MTDTLSELSALNFIGGEWATSESGRTYERRNPWRPSEVVGQFPSSSAADVEAAVHAAQSACPGWAALPAA
jgi:aldehyde dehydrogenase (NAD+)